MAGIILDHGRFLVEKRTSEDVDPGFVAIPGGHVGETESTENALVREMREELGITVQEMKPVHIGRHTATDGEKQRIHYFHAVKWMGRIQSFEAEKTYWESETSALTAASDRTAVKKLIQKLR